MTSITTPERPKYEVTDRIIMVTHPTGHVYQWEWLAGGQIVYRQIRGKTE